MSRHFSNFLTANGNVEFRLFDPRADVDPTVSFQVAGTFGSGTLVVEATLDGTNYTPVKDSSGTAISLTAADIFNVTLYTGDPNSPGRVRFTLTGATSPNIQVTMTRRQ